MQSSITTSQKHCMGDQWTSLIPAMISTSFGGAVIGCSIPYLFTFWLQNRFIQTNLPDLISTGFQIVSITSGCRLVLQVFLDLCKPGAMMEWTSFTLATAARQFCESLLQL